MSSISSVNGSGGGFSMMMSGMKRPDPSKMADNLFSKLDTTNKGYLEKSDLQSALSQLSGSDSSNSSSSSTTVDEIFKKLDSNSDNKITKDEMSSGMKKLADALDSQFNEMRMNGTLQGAPETQRQHMVCIDQTHPKWWMTYFPSSTRRTRVIWKRVTCNRH